MALAGIRLHDITVPNIKWLICFQRHRFEHCHCSVVIETKSSYQGARKTAEIGSHLCCMCPGVCACMCGDPNSSLFIISHHITLHWWQHPHLQWIPVRPGGDESILRQNDSAGFLLRSLHPHTPTHRLTHCTLAEAQSVSTPPLLPSILSPSASDVMWMDADAGGLFCNTAFHPSTQNQTRERRREEEKEGGRGRIC